MVGNSRNSQEDPKGEGFLPEYKIQDPGGSICRAVRVHAAGNHVRRPDSAHLPAALGGHHTAAKIGVGAENCADKASGAYTGEVSAEMVASTGAKYVILGHSERRAYYGETVAILEEKVKLALANGLTPIFCIGDRKSVV